ncbi:unnamed protein product [Urochloa humidicola]
MELPENKLTDFIKSSEKEKWRTVNNHNISNFTEDEIKQISNNYSTLIGEGGFGRVYKGALDDGTPVAVKKYRRQNLKEGFGKEIIAHCQINHKNVVRLLGYCEEENALMIVTEYVSGGNLRDLLHGRDDPISLDERLRIAIECADALGYMHSSMYQPIVHGDIKPDNILLDSKFGAKLSDFGLSRLLSMDKTQYTMNVSGSIGYMDPEYIETGLVDPKSDVYSFGVVLLELITRSQAIENGFSTRLKRNFTDALREGKQEARKMFDSEISNDRNIDIIDEIGNLAAECLKREIKERPEMKDVQERLQMLRRALHCEQAQEKRGQKVNKHGLHGTSISSSSSLSTVTYKLSILDIFNRNARWYERNAGPMLEKTCNLSIFTKRGLKKITKNYSEVIGRSYFSDVYMGCIEGDRVVVTKSRPEYDDRTYDTLDFATAMQTASSLLHKNIIRLVGCCLETEVPRLVYEFASGGSLDDVLRGSCRLPLELRLDIAIGSAEALAYVHSVKPNNIVHGDFSAKNTLLDDNFVPKVSGIFPGILSYIAHGNVAADISYIDPVYCKTGRFTSKSDVYSFGIVLLELITRKQAKYVDNSYTFSLPIKYVEVWKKENSGKAMFDMEVAVEGNISILEDMGKLAVECLKEDIEERPEMAVVAKRLKNLKRDWKRGQGAFGSSQADDERTGAH